MLADPEAPGHKAVTGCNLSPDKSASASTSRAANAAVGPMRSNQRVTRRSRDGRWRPAEYNIVSLPTTSNEADSQRHWPTNDACEHQITANEQEEIFRYR